MQEIARVLKSNGSEGELVMSFTGLSPEEIDTEEPVFIYVDGLPVPFYFESFVQRGNSRALVRLTGVRSLRDADELAGASVYAEDGLYEDEESSVEGWTVVDQNGRTVGQVSGYEDIPGNLCLAVQTKEGQEVLLPFHEDLVLGADRENRILQLTVPDGLLD